jgi:hypothetical protein
MPKKRRRQLSRLHANAPITWPPQAVNNPRHARASDSLAVRFRITKIPNAMPSSSNGAIDGSLTRDAGVELDGAVVAGTPDPGEYRNSTVSVLGYPACEFQD